MISRIIIEKDFWDIFSSMGILIVGGITVFVAIRQYENDKNRMKLALYEKRFAVFRAIMDLNTIIFRDANVTIEDLRIFLSNSREANFLFDRKIKNEVEEIYQKAIRLRYVETKLDDRGLDVGEKRNKLAEESNEILTWFGEMPKRMEESFKKYLSMSNL